jgi:hypothetical protein
MSKYAKVTNQETGLCEVGLGTNEQFYQSIGMVELDVTQSDIDNNWYLASMCPMKTDEQKEQEEKERIAKLYLTGADVERGIYKAKGMDFEDIVAYVTQLQPEGLDIKALKIELKANNFYRGNPYVVAIGQLLGFTEEQLNLFFEDGNYEHLLPMEEPTETPIETPVEEPTETQNEIVEEETEVEDEIS